MAELLALAKEFGWHVALLGYVVWSQYAFIKDVRKEAQAARNETAKAHADAAAAAARHMEEKNKLAERMLNMQNNFHNSIGDLRNALKDVYRVLRDFLPPHRAAQYRTPAAGTQVQSDGDTSAITLNGLAARAAARSPHVRPL